MRGSHYLSGVDGERLGISNGSENNIAIIAPRKCYSIWRILIENKIKVVKHVVYFEENRKIDWKRRVQSCLHYEVIVMT